MAITFVPLNIMKPDKTYVDLSSTFNGRVGDSKSYVPIQFLRDNIPLDLTGKTVSLTGKDSNSTPIKIYGTADTDIPGANLQAGKVAFHFPAGVFQVEGDWDFSSTYFSVSDSDGSIISTINVGIHVLSNSVDMGINAAPFITDLQVIVDKMNTFVAEQEKNIEKTTHEVLDDTSTLNTTLAAVKKQVVAYQELINNGAVITQADLDKAVNAINFYTQTAKASTPSDYIDMFKTQGSGIYHEVLDGTYVGLTDDAFALETHVPDIKFTSIGIYQQATKTDPNTNRIDRFVRTAKSKTEWNAWQQMAIF